MPQIEPLDLLNAYCEGVFPMGDDDGSISWFRPKMRGILPIADFHLPARFERYFKSHPFEVRWNTAFGDVVRGCADRPSTWINETILDTYEELHRIGHAHSAEVWRDGRLVGGVYGVSIGAAFFGESMFTTVRDGSKMALAMLVSAARRHGVEMIDCQQNTRHLASLGAHDIPREDFVRWVTSAQCEAPIAWENETLYWDALAPTAP
jgi:leucyl/phenylalanyl-tRNA--protein transferase